jgi:hypothetical protein
LFLLAQQNEKSSSILPVATFGRKYAYIDEKIAGSLMPLKLRPRRKRAGLRSAKANDVRTMF